MTSSQVTVTDLSTGIIQIIEGGIPGPQGPAGPAGGPKGDKGDTGDTGPIGLTGPPGLPGPQGSVGPIGPQGRAGIDGIIGPPGPQGLKGDKGDKGDGGSPGTNGVKGDKGDTGPQGVVGPQGPVGATGAAGLKGDTGSMGPIGLRGPQGLQGVAGPQGLKGDTGSVGPTGPQGPKGDRGTDGDQGIQGVQGIQGPIGPTGLTGSQGPVGPQGDKGDQGDIGPIGPAGGPPGPTGDPGLPGIVAINHGTDGTVARPDATIVYWIGSAVPLNGAETDFWYGSSSDQPQSLADTLTQANAYTDTSISGLYSKFSPSNNLASGQFAPGRREVNGITSAMASGILFGPCFVADKTETVSNVTLYTGTTAAAATPTLVRIGIYFLDALGNATLVGSTPTDTTLFSATNTQYAKALTSSFTKTAGNRYFIGILVVSGAATPNFVGFVGAASTQADSIFAVLPALSYQLSGQTDLPASIATASLTNGTRNMPLVRLG